MHKTKNTVHWGVQANMLSALGIRNGFVASTNLTRACGGSMATAVSAPSRVAMAAALSLVLDAHPHPHRQLGHHSTADAGACIRKSQTSTRSLSPRVRRSVGEQCARFLRGAEGGPRGCSGMATSGYQQGSTRWRRQCAGKSRSRRCSACCLSPQWLCDIVAQSICA